MCSCKSTLVFFYFTFRESSDSTRACIEVLIGGNSQPYGEGPEKRSVYVRIFIYITLNTKMYSLIKWGTEKFPKDNINLLLGMNIDNGCSEVC